MTTTPLTTAIDTNVLVSLWGPDPTLNDAAGMALDAAAEMGALVVSPPVFSELMAAPRITEDRLAQFFADMGIAVEWVITENAWRAAGRAHRAYAQRRRHSGDPHPRRILADFLIGAHALTNGYALLTLDKSGFRAAFPALKLLTF